MADRETTYTEAQVRERERKAFYTGACFEHRFQKRNERPSTMSEVLNEAAEHYPAPTKPRVVTVADRAWPAREFRVVGGQLQSRTPGVHPSNGFPYPWTACAQITPTPKMVAALADLLAHPEEPAND